MIAEALIKHPRAGSDGRDEGRTRARKDKEKKKKQHTNNPGKVVGSSFAPSFSSWPPAPPPPRLPLPRRARWRIRAGGREISHCRVVAAVRSPSLSDMREDRSGFGKDRKSGIHSHTLTHAHSHTHTHTCGKNPNPDLGKQANHIHRSSQIHFGGKKKKKTLKEQFQPTGAFYNGVLPSPPTEEQ